MPPGNLDPIRISVNPALISPGFTSIPAAGESLNVNVIVQSATQQLPVPQIVTASQIGTTSSVNVSWNPVNNASSYNVLWRLSTAATWNTVAVPTGTSQSIDVGTTTGTFEFKVIAVGTGNFTNSPDSVVQSITMQVTPQQLPAPQNVTASQVGTTSSVNVFWGAVTNASSYNVLWRLSTAATWNTVAVPTGTSQSIDVGTTTGTFEFKVIAVGTGSFTNSPDSAIRSVTMGAPIHRVYTTADSSINAVPGGWFSIDIKHELLNLPEDRTGGFGMGLRIEFDPSLIPTITNRAPSAQPFTTQPGVVTVSWLDFTNNWNPNDLVSLRFNVDANAPLGNLEPIRVFVVDGSITPGFIATPPSGVSIDINVTVVQPTLDITGNGTVELVDMLLLHRYIVNKDNPLLSELAKQR